jgi:hypothetical protein
MKRETAIQKGIMLDRLKNKCLYVSFRHSWPNGGGAGAMGTYSDLYEFVKAVLTHWIALMSGLAALLITVWEKVREKQLAKRFFNLIAVLCIFTAFFFAWRDEHSKFKPDFRLEISGINSHPRGEDKIGVLLIVRVGNIGESSALENWKLSATLIDGRTFNGQLVKLPDRVILQGPQGVQEFKGSDNIVELSLIPVAKGKILPGIIYFEFDIEHRPNVLVSDVFLTGTLFVLSCTDVVGNSYKIEQKLGIPGGLKQFPGIDIQIR